MRTLLALAVLASLAVPSLAQTQSAPANETATDFYMRYRAMIPKATTTDQIVAFLERRSGASVQRSSGVRQGGLGRAEEGLQHAHERESREGNGDAQPRNSEP